MGIDVCPARQEQLDNVSVIFENGPHERGLPMHGVFGLNGCSAIEKQFHRIDFADSSGRHESSFAAGIGAIRIDASVQKFTDHGGASVGGREIDRRNAVAVHGVHVRAIFNQSVSGLEIVVANRPVQGGGAVGIDQPRAAGGRGIGPRSEQRHAEQKDSQL